MIIRCSTRGKDNHIKTSHLLDRSLTAASIAMANAERMITEFTLRLANKQEIKEILGMN